jgi:urease accessory protein
MTTTATTMDTAGTAIRTDAALLRLVWLASPALPVGGFSYSEGMEGAVDAGLVTNEATAVNWLVDQLHLALAESDLSVVGAALDAFRAADMERVATLDAWVRRTRETSELKLQAEQMGRSLGEWMKSVGREGAGYTWPVAFAHAAADIDCSTREVALVFAFAWAEAMAQAAIKAVPLGQGGGQRILQRLAAEIPVAVDHALALGDDARQAFTPMLAILSARHETQYSRLFRS